MNALRRIHAVLVPGGLVVDSQPVSVRPPVVVRETTLGHLDMRGWGKVIERTDGRMGAALAGGLFEVASDREVLIADTFADGAALLGAVSDWVGTRVDDDLAARVRAVRGPVRVLQQVRMRILRAGPGS